MCVYFNDFLEGLKTQLKPVGGAAVSVLPSILIINNNLYIIYFANKF